MRVGDKFNGYENGKHWSVECIGEIIRITVENEVYDYECEFRPIFGYDAYDVSSMEEKLDEMLKGE